MLNRCFVSILFIIILASSQSLRENKNDRDNIYRRVQSGFDITSAKSVGQKLLSLIYNRYEINGPIGSQFFLTSANIGHSQWDMIKYKIALRALQGNQTYFMLFGGSSVTAGHDNYFSDSFPMIVQKRMQPLFDTLGIDLTVRNIAQGNNPCEPYGFAYEAMGGSDPDFLHWEQVFIIMSMISTHHIICILPSSYACSRSTVVMIMLSSSQSFD